jgi:N4-gp56 family major capsid protein
MPDTTDFAVKYAQAVDERFTLASLTESAVNKNYDFTGVRTVKVYNIPTVAMNDYQMSGLTRYGTPTDLVAPTQELTVSRDRAFTFVIDKRDNLDTQGALEAGRALARQIDEKVIPEVDIYRLATMAANAGKTATAAVDKTNAYSALLDASVWLTEKSCPVVGRVAFVSPEFYKNIKLDPGFVKTGDLAQDMLIKGQVGAVDGIALVLAPSTYLPANTAFIVTHPVATVAAQKIAEYKTHDNPPGISGKLVEGRVCYDAFVLDNKKDVVYVHTTP